MNLLLFLSRKSSVGTIFTGILDTYEGAVVAYSRDRLAASTTDVIRVRRSTGGEADFSYTEVTDGTLISWVGAGNDGFVVTAFGQSDTIDSSQVVASEQPLIVSSGSLVNGIQFDGVVDNFDITLATALNGTILIATTEGTYAADIELSDGSYIISAKGVSDDRSRLAMKNVIGWLLFDRVLSTSEITSITDYFVTKGAEEDFGSVTTFSSAWRNCHSLTSFPLIDTSNGISFTFTWRDCRGLTNFPLIDTSNATLLDNTWQSCLNLTSFPAINASSATSMKNTWRACISLTSFPLININNNRNFERTWQSCSSLEDFPSGFFDTWAPSNLIERVFLETWGGCTSLTSQSVENILTSIDTSGRYGTDTGLVSGTILSDNTIDIDYDGSGLTAATSTAITNLKAKDWQIEINGVLQ